MAKIHAAPTAIKRPVPDYTNYNWEKEQEAEADYLKRLAAWCRGRYDGELVGKILRTPRGDGYAQYMVMRHRPFALIHLPLGDAWRADEIWERAVNLSDARMMVDRDKVMVKLARGVK